MVFAAFQRCTSRLFPLLLYALLLLLAGAPALAHCRPENPIGNDVHKYLYVQDNPVNGIDPSGNDLIGTLGTFAMNTYVSAMSTAATMASYGYLETFIFVTAIGYQEAYMQSGWSGVGVQAGISLIPVGKLVPVVRQFPSWLKVSEIEQMSQTLWTETLHAVPSAGRNAAASALRFPQQIKPGSIVVKGAGGAGVDITAIAVVNGAEKSLARELVAVQGDLSKNGGKALYDALCQKAEKQAVNADIREIQLEVTADAASVSNIRELVKEKLQLFSQAHSDVAVHVVDSAGNDFLQ